MDLDPDYIIRNLSKIGRKEANSLLREWIVSSNDINLRKKALKQLGAIDDFKNFKFFVNISKNLFLFFALFSVKLFSEIF